MLGLGQLPGAFAYQMLQILVEKQQFITDGLKLLLVFGYLAIYSPDPLEKQGDRRHEHEHQGIDRAAVGTNG